MVGKLQEGVALGLAILGQRVVLVDDLAKLEEIQLVKNLINTFYRVKGCS